ncbi:Cof-type HAD-IIB family hydrolase [Nesterenkonia sp. CL21]|uniref:Cof-type HAD-IIB family hydrolase n=1 Tax=Nesterenkonia sp. CL21 TaxID=3064894 RepID=UPI00287819A4|nr:Cof-type HAD-IIB family hydrolase [Nesterenkonia sp. CL21]MDS2173371.1 Cof-type HAD-IIB family hydrolase [Nesterenkonia sp. CL21]
MPGLRSAPVTTLERTRLIASDIDGTILSYASAQTGVVTERTVAAFRAARAAGVRVVLVTGRPVRWLKPVADALGGIGPVICSNGAVVYDLAEDRLLRQDPIDQDIVFTVQEQIRQIDPEASFAAETLQKVHAEPPFLVDSLFFEEDRRRAAGVTDDMLSLGPLEETLSADRPEAGEGSGVVKLLAKTTVMDADAFLEAVRAKAGALVTVTHSAPGVSLLELSAKGVDKAAALRRFAAAEGITRDQVIAFGDMPNDIEMLQWAGTSWAVGSGHPMARSAAQHLTADCDEDGVAQVLEDLIDGGDGVLCGTS